MLLPRHATTASEQRPSASAEPGDGPMTSNHEVDSVLASSLARPFILRLIGTLFLANACDSVEVLSVGYILNKYRDSDGHGLTSTEEEVLTAAVYAGMLIGGLSSGFMSDRSGRRVCLVAALLVNVIAALASAAAPNTAWLIVCRVLAGVGVGGTQPTIWTIAAEFLPVKRRGAYVSVISSAWIAGSVFTAASAWVMLGKDINGNEMMDVSWRAFILWCAVPAGLALIATYLVLPESPRFLVRTGKAQQAAEVLEAIQRQGSSTLPRRTRYSRTDADSLIKASDRDPFDEHEDARPSTSLVLDEDAAVEEASWDQLQALLEPPLCLPFQCLVTIWFCLSFGYYGLATWITVLFDDIGLSNVYAAAFFYASANLPGNILAFFMIEQIGRKRLLTLALLVACFAACLFSFATVGSHTQAWLVVLAACVFNACTNMAWTAVSCLSAECFPTVVRASAVGVLSAMGRIGSVSAQFVNGSLQGTVWLLLLVTAANMLLAVYASATLPHETSGVTLK